jgi:hypothetical protein
MTVAKTRAPNGAKALAKGFIDALAAIPARNRVEVAKAAQVILKENLKPVLAEAKDEAKASLARSPRTKGVLKAKRANGKVRAGRKVYIQDASAAA